MMRSLAIFLSGWASALAGSSALQHRWVMFSFFMAWAVGALTWAILPREESGATDAARQFRNARLRLVRREDRT